MAKLRGRGAHTGERELEGPLARVGRGAESEVCVDDPAISRLHARIECDGGVWRVVDCESTNGTKVDTAILRPWQPHILAHGAVIEFGRAVTFDFLLSEAERAGGVAATIRQVAKRDVRLTPTETQVMELLFVHYDEGRPSPRLATMKEIAQLRNTSNAAVKMVMQGLYDKCDLFDDERNKEILALRVQQWSVTRTRY